MTRVIIVCALLAGSVAASCTGDGISAGTAISPIDPFGREATVGGDELVGGGEALLDLCGRACANIASCEGGGDADCATDCATDVPPGCEPEFRAFVQCVATAPICVNGSADPLVCTAAYAAVDACARGSTGGSSGGGTGAAGATGTTAPPPPR